MRPLDPKSALRVDAPISDCAHVTGMVSDSTNACLILTTIFWGELDIVSDPVHFEHASHSYNGATWTCPSGVSECSECDSLQTCPSTGLLPVIEITPPASFRKRIADLRLSSEAKTRPQQSNLCMWRAKPNAWVQAGYAG